MPALVIAALLLAQGDVVLSAADIGDGTETHFFEPRTVAAGETIIRLEAAARLGGRFLCDVEAASFNKRVDHSICDWSARSSHLRMALRRSAPADALPIRLRVDWTWSEHRGLAATFRHLTQRRASATGRQPNPAGDAIIESAAVEGCPPPRTDGRGDRALIASDGTSFVLQCGDGTVRAWSARTKAVENLGQKTLFEAAQALGLLPADLVCPSEVELAAGAKADCDVVYSVGDTFLLRGETLSTFLVRRGRSKPLRAFSTFEEAGVLIPRQGNSTQVVVVNGERIPAILQAVDIGSGRVEPRAKLPSRNLIFEDGEGRATDVAYSQAHNLVVIGYSGVFQVARQMTYLRAFSPDGMQAWNVAREIAEESDGGAAGDATSLKLFDEGRYAALARSSDRTLTTIYDVGSGKEVGRVQGWLVGAAKGTRQLLVRTDGGRVALIAWGQDAR